MDDAGRRTTTPSRAGARSPPPPRPRADDDELAYFRSQGARNGASTSRRAATTTTPCRGGRGPGAPGAAAEEVALGPSLRLPHAPRLEDGADDAVAERRQVRGDVVGRLVQDVRRAGAPGVLRVEHPH